MDHFPGPAHETVVHEGLGAILAPGLEPLFRRPTRLDVISAWYGHIPFAHWLIRATKPATLVELGTHNGVSYSAFCEAILAERLPTRCTAVDTWKGDEHAGFYGDDVFSSLQAFHAARYAGFSQMLRCTFDEALPYIADGSVDLLHIDGRHHYDDVAHDYRTWVPKLSDRAVVLFHDTNVRERQFGVWRLWEELAAAHPAFEFLHTHGLGVLAVGTNAPAPITELCNLQGDALNLVRERFATLGERWSLSGFSRAYEDARAWGSKAQAEVNTLYPAYQTLLAAHRTSRTQLAQARFTLAQAEIDRERAEASRVEADLLREQREIAAREQAQEQARTALEQERADRGRAAAAASEAQAAEQTARRAAAASQAEAAALRDLLEEARVEADTLRTWQQVIVRSPAWRAGRRLGRLARLNATLSAPEPHWPPLPNLIEAAPEPPVVPPSPPLEALPVQQADPEPAPPPETEPEPVPEPEPPERPAIASAKPRALFISGESHTPGHTYRIERALAAARAIGWDADWSEPGPVNPDLIEGASVVMLWRIPHSQHIQGIIDCAHAMGARVLFDIDDLMFRRDYATTRMIDGIRSQRFSETDTQDFFERIGRTMAAVDLVTCPTEELASQVRYVGKPAFILPNGFDDATAAASRLAVRTWRGFADPILRIGYAGGSRTHQRDFAQTVPALARILAERPLLRLVLFRDPRSGEGVVLADEFEALNPVAAQIEWRDMVPLAGLPAELARFDINLAPLEPDNLFTAAKSELKYFEAALAGIPTIASPVGRLGRAITQGQTGRLAATGEDWYTAIRSLLDDPAERQRLGRNAYHDALWRYSETARRDRLRSLFNQLEGGIAAATAFDHDLLRTGARTRPLPTIPQSETAFSEDRLGEAAVTVIVPLHNYADYVVEALESVAAQTLPILDLVIVDDASTDDSLAMATGWCEAHRARFNRLQILRHIQNTGLAGARNSGFAAAETPYVLPLDADNRLRADCCERLLTALARTEAAFAYPAIKQFGDGTAIIGAERFSALRLLQGNYIDAMALVAKWAWAGAGGYENIQHGWEDFDFWARIVELGQFGLSVPDVLADYRVHRASMLHTETEVHDHKRILVADLTARHPWLDIGRLAEVTPQP